MYLYNLIYVSGTDGRSPEFCSPVLPGVCNASKKKFKNIRRSHSFNQLWPLKTGVVGYGFPGKRNFLGIALLTSAHIVAFSEQCQFSMHRNSHGFRASAQFDIASDRSSSASHIDPEACSKVLRVRPQLLKASQYVSAVGMDRAGSFEPESSV